MSKTKILLVLFAAGLTGARLALPNVLRDQANKKLAALPGYHGHVDGVDIALWRGLFSFKRVSFSDTTGDLAMESNACDISLNWAQLLRGKMICDLGFDHPKVRLVVKTSLPDKKPAPVQSIGQTPPSVLNDVSLNFSDILTKLLPLRVDRFEIKAGTFALQVGATPPEFPFLENLSAVATNFSNAQKSPGTLFSSGRATANVGGSGHITLDLQMNPTAKPPAFTLTVAAQQIPLKNLEALLKWQTGLRFKSGRLTLNANAEAGNGGYRGQVSPSVDDLEVEGPKTKESFVLKVDKVVTTGDSIGDDANQIPFQGRFARADEDLSQAVLEVLRAAFLEALKPNLDPSLNREP